ncbi:MAG TPA: cation:proton antiporter [Patescibacteria group bacterium]|nr:cation:proton antiporter [Patescibacteria group bacterium]
MNNVFLQLALVLSLSSFFGFFVHKLKLPLIIAYLVSGVTLALVGQFDPKTLGIFKILPDLGIAFVLFLIGMELDLREIRLLGKPIIIGSLAQIIISTSAGFALAGFFGFSPISSLLMGLGLGFSSTVVVVQLLLEKRDLTSLYGKLSLGILLVEDLIAILALMFISIGSINGQFSAEQSLPVIYLGLKAIGLFVLTFILSKYLLKKLFDSVATSIELLFLTAVTWCFLFTALAVLSGFSVVIGAFLAGVALATSPYHLQIQGKIKPLRDFFVAMFFIFLGSQVILSDLASVWWVIVVFTAFAVFFKPLIFLLVLGIFGFRKHTIFQTSLNLSQISEFALIILLVGVEMNLVPQITLSVMAPVTVLSIIISAVLISQSKNIYTFFSPFLSFFEHKTNIHYMETKQLDGLEDHVVVIGAHRVGGPVVTFLHENKIPFVVMDFNPHVVEALKKKGVNVLYGDAGDLEMYENLKLEEAKLIISTTRDLYDNEILLDECKKKKIRAKIIARAMDHEHAKALRILGADYVIMPEQVSGEYLVNQLKHHWPEMNFSGMK